MFGREVGGGEGNMGGECPPGGEGPGSPGPVRVRVVGALRRGGGGLLGDTGQAEVMAGLRGGGDRAPPVLPDPDRTLILSSPTTAPGVWSSMATVVGNS